VIVLPFENLSGNRKYDSFSDGLTEEMITQLGRLNPARLGVIARTSAMTYKSTEKTIEQIGREVGVSHALEGSVRRSGNRVRITAQLIQVSDQTHVWAESYDGKLEDIFSLQSAISREVARHIHITLLAPETAKRVVPEAYESYLKGRFHWNRRTERDLHASMRCFQDAIECDPTFPPAYSGMADTQLTLMDYGFLTPREATASARSLATKAIQLDEGIAEAHISLGHAAFHDFDLRTAEREFLRGIDLNPNYAAGRFYYANFLIAKDRRDEAVAEAREAVRLDPVSPNAHSNLAAILWHAHRYEQSTQQAQKALDLDPSYPRAYEDLGRALEQMGEIEKAIVAFQKSAELEPGSHSSWASLGHAYALAGQAGDALKILRQLEELSTRTFVSAYSFAIISIALGRRDEAFEWLDKAYEERSSALPFLTANPRMTALHDDVRFQALLARLGLPDGS
jgi:TolB-like protein/Flp pilus assembly protein TadD